MAEDVYPVRWTGHQAVVTFPEQIDVSNAGQIREQLLSVINRGAAVVIADMTDTVSCDHAGVDAIGRAYQRALVSGTELRLVVGSEIVRSFVAACLAAKNTSTGPELGGPAKTARMGTNGQNVPGQAAPAAADLAEFARAAARQARHRQELLDRITTSLYRVGLTLQDATDQPLDAARQAITDSLEGLDTTIREIRDVAFTDSIRSFPPPQDED